jgi:nucleoside-diphosphate-sugar epimerase
MSTIIEETKNIISFIDFEGLKNKKILITGASGLVGLYLVSCLNHLIKTHNIKIFVWVKSDIDPNVKLIFDNCTIIQSDITNLDNFDLLPNFDYIIHSAGYGQPDRFMEDKIKTIQLNTSSTINLFNKLDKSGRFLFLSTSELYSGLDYENIKEFEIGTTTPNHPRSCYIEGKRCGESICNIYKDMGYDVKIVRLSLAYGPGTKKHDKRVINSLIEKGIKNDKITLLDSGEAIRTYCYITDVIEMIWNIFLFGKESLYNVGGNSITSIYELSLLIGDMLKKPVEIPLNLNKQIGNPKIVNVSIEKYKSEFGEKPFIDLKTGLKNTINWQKNIYND